MILGLSIEHFTLLHVFISLIGMVAGVQLLVAMVAGWSLRGWTELFLAATILTSVTGFFFPLAAVSPAQIFGAISLLALGLALFALRAKELAGRWRHVYVASVALALYLNLFVGVVQAFQKIALLQPLAPTQSEPPFLVAQLFLLGSFIALATVALRRFRPS